MCNQLFKYTLTQIESIHDHELCFIVVTTNWMHTFVNIMTVIGTQYTFTTL